VEALPVLARGAAMRFLATARYDWLHTPADALVTRKDPMDFARRLSFYATQGEPGLSPLTPRRHDKAMKHVDIFTDGACKGNPGPGGWGVLLRMGSHEKELSGGETHTTTTAGDDRRDPRLKALIEPCEVTLHSRQPLRDRRHDQVVAGWQKKGWISASRKPVRNEDLWHDLIEAAAPHRITWQWVKGHDGHPENERVDQLASAAAEAAKG
jgi:ribonuclease HI